MGNTCINCGTIISSGSLVCASCGAPQRQIPKPTPQKGGISPGGFCGSCGTRLTSKYSPCPNCGHVKTMYNPRPDSGNPNPNPGNQNWGAGNPNPPPPYQQQQGGLEKNVATTLILAIVLGLLGLGGIGHIYIGQTNRGVKILVAGILLWIIGILTAGFGVGIALLIAYVVLLIWQMFDANKLVNQYNQYLRQNGRPPW